MRARGGGCTAGARRAPRPPPAAASGWAVLGSSPGVVVVSCMADVFMMIASCLLGSGCYLFFVACLLTQSCIPRSSPYALAARLST